MPKLPKPIQGLIVVVLAVIVGGVLYTFIGENEEEGFLGIVTYDVEVPVSPSLDGTPDATDFVATPEPGAETEEPTSGTPSIETRTQSFPTPLGADVNMVYQWFMFLGLLLGASFAVRKDFTSHRNTMTFLVLTNWFSIAGRMFKNVEGYLDAVNPNFSQEAIYAHAGLGIVVMVFGSYLILRMWFEKQLPAWIKINPIKVWMRLTLVTWLALIALGTFMYFDIYS